MLPVAASSAALYSERALFFTVPTPAPVGSTKCLQSDTTLRPAYCASFVCVAACGTTPPASSSACPAGKYNSCGCSVTNSDTYRWFQRQQNLNATGSATCGECPGGRFDPRPGAFDVGAAPGLEACVCRCAAGSFSKPGSAACTLCRPGSFAAYETSRSCNLCAPGHYQAKPGATECEACPSGEHASEPGAAACVAVSSPGSYVSHGIELPCSAGRFSTASAQLRCELCAAGRYQSSGGKTGCAACPGGKFQNATGQPFCDTCSEGFVCSVNNSTGLVEKQQCPPGKSCSGTRVEPCVNQISNQATGKCISCEDRHYANTQTNACTECPQLREGSEALALGVECSNGGIAFKDDFFVVPDDDAAAAGIGPRTATLRCRDADVCTTIVDGETFTAHTRCRGNATGLLCGLCSEGFGKAAGSCVECPSQDIQSGAMWAFALLAVGVALGMTKKSLNPDFTGALVTVIRIGFDWLGMTGFLAQLQLDWGSVLRQIFSIAEASSGGMPPFLDCSGVSFETEMAMSLLLPLLVPTVAAALLGAWFLVQKALKKQTATLWEVSKQHFFINACVAIGFVLWPVLVTQLLRIVDCSIAVGGARYVGSAVDVQCFAGTHATLYAAAIAELVLVVPLFPAGLLHRLHNGDMRDGSWNRKHLFFLYGGFRKGFEYWEAVVLGRKFLVLMAGVFLKDNSFGLQVSAVMWVVCTATLLQLMCQPYENSTEQRLETLSLLGTTISLMIGQLILQANGADGLGATRLAICQWCVICITFFTACCFVLFFVREVAAARRAKKEAVAEWQARTGKSSSTSNFSGLRAWTSQASSRLRATTASKGAAAGATEGDETADEAGVDGIGTFSNPMHLAPADPNRQHSAAEPPQRTGGVAQHGHVYAPGTGGHEGSSEQNVSSRLTASASHLVASGGAVLRRAVTGGGAAVSGAVDVFL